MALLTINIPATHKTVTCPHCGYAQLLISKEAAKLIEERDPEILAKLHCGGPTSAHQLNLETYTFFGTYYPERHQN